MPSESSQIPKNPDNTEDIRRITLIGVGVNIILGVFKLLVGSLSRSHALMADGVHSLSDLFTDLALLLGVKYWSRPPDDCHPYGHGRIETAVNIIIGGLIIAVALGIAGKSLERLNHPDAGAPGLSALLVAMASIFSKEILFRWTLHKGKKSNCRALIANAWHHRSDSLSSIPVAVAVVWGHFFPHQVYVDSIAAIIVTAMLLGAGFKILWPSVRELLEFREDIVLEDWLLKQQAHFPEILEIHRIRSRRIGSTILLDLHLLVNGGMSVHDAHQLATDFKHHVRREDSRVADVLIHIEPHCESLNKELQ